MRGELQCRRLMQLPQCLLAHAGNRGVGEMNRKQGSNPVSFHVPATTALHCCVMKSERKMREASELSKVPHHDFTRPRHLSSTRLEKFGFVGRSAGSSAFHNNDSPANNPMFHIRPPREVASASDWPVSLGGRNTLWQTWLMSCSSWYEIRSITCLGTTIVTVHHAWARMPRATCVRDSVVADDRPDAVSASKAGSASRSSKTTTTTDMSIIRT